MRDHVSGLEYREKRCQIWHLRDWKLKYNKKNKNMKEGITRYSGWGLLVVFVQQHRREKKMNVYEFKNKRYKMLRPIYKF